MISLSSNDQTRDNSENKRDKFHKMREYVTEQFDLNQVGNKNKDKHNSRKGNIKKKLISSRFNSSDKRNISRSLRVKDEIKATPRRENQGLNFNFWRVRGFSLNFLLIKTFKYSSEIYKRRNKQTDV